MMDVNGGRITAVVDGTKNNIKSYKLGTDIDLGIKEFFNIDKEEYR